MSRRLKSLLALAAILWIVAGCGGGANEVADADPSTPPIPAATDGPTSDATEPSDDAPASPSSTPTDEPTSVATATPDEPAAGPSATPEPESTPVPESTSEEEEPPALVAVGDGDTGEDVQRLQERLDELGYAPGPADGVFGRRTANAVSAFQHAAGIGISGQADEATIAALADAAAFEVLRPGDRGAAVDDLQTVLGEGPFDPGATDGVYGTKTVQAVYALEKRAGIAVDGIFDGTDAWALDRLGAGDVGSPESSHDRRWVEVDLSRQLMSIYDPGSSIPVLVSHVSTGNGERWCNDTAGCRVASTPTGSFAIERRIAGWRESSLDIGRLYNPLYFRGGIALHGALSVPTYPASHGCVRVPMHIAEYLPDMLPNGTPVEVLA